MILDFLKLVFQALVQLDAARFKGWAGETVTRRSFLGKLDPTIYRCYHDLYLPRPDGKGTTQVDHVVVSEFGVFVIETKSGTQCVRSLPGERRARQFWTGPCNGRKWAVCIMPSGRDCSAGSLCAAAGWGGKRIRRRWTGRRAGRF